MMLKRFPGWLTVVANLKALPECRSGFPESGRYSQSRKVFQIIYSVKGSNQLLKVCQNVVLDSQKKERTFPDAKSVPNRRFCKRNRSNSESMPECRSGPPEGAGPSQRRKVLQIVVSVTRIDQILKACQNVVLDPQKGEDPPRGEKCSKSTFV